MARSRATRYAQQQRARDRLQRQARAEAERVARAQAAEVRAAERKARGAHLAEQDRRAANATTEIDRRVAELGSILTDGLHRSARIDLATTRHQAHAPSVDLGTLGKPEPAPRWEDFLPPSPGWLSRAFGGEGRYAARRAAADREFAAAKASYDAADVERQRRVRGIRARHAAASAEAAAAAAASDRRRAARMAGLDARSRDVVENYLTEVLAAVPLPTGFPTRREVTYSAEEEHAVVRFELPATDVVPTTRAVAYVKARDECVARERPIRQCADLYRSVISQVSLLAIRDLFDADSGLQKVSFSGHVSRTNSATGRAEYPCLLSVVVEREELATLVLDRVTAEDCLRHLEALVSAHPYSVVGVRPLIDFDRSRYAFVEGVDVVAGLDHRDDLMRLTPTDFEHLVRQLFEATPGMQGWTTQASRDDGVDAVIFNATPITGGLTVVQAKQYSTSIGVQHVRELAGTMEDKKAGRGILVSTSRFTKDAEVLSERLGRIQLIGGAELVYLLKEHLDKDVVIGRRAKRP